MIWYLDTSALVKLFVPEPGAELVSRTLADAAGVASHQIAYAEMRAAFAKAARIGRLDRADLDRVVGAFEPLWAALDIVGVTDPLIRRAGELAQRHGLRGYDSVHLSAALTLRDALGSANPLGFGTFDAALRDAAAGHALVLLPVT